ncbi:helix-turn-helix domain-containing protein [Psychrobium sp. nBUS_13]|uniref:helix-turn-helix domain-containing protein n=1 Tax=Psychrobium sp. nBUS_13 TaxID=3395319 RepID=UPI003EBE72A9
MNVNATLIKEHRTSRALTQQHLADACDVSLRTIQRVERYGNASSETLMSLSSVFEIETSALLITEDQSSNKETQVIVHRPSLLPITIALITGTAIGAAATYLFVQ